MLCQRNYGLVRAVRPQAPAAKASQKAVASSIPSQTRRQFSAKATTLPPTLRFSQLYQQPIARSASYHTSNSLSRPAETPTAEPESSTTPTPKVEKPDFLDAAESEIWDRLVKEFDPMELLVQDISGGCGSMYGIEISSEKFRGANMLKQQRMVNAVLGDLMKGWHGVQLKTRVP